MIHPDWLTPLKDTVSSYRNTIYKTIDQLTDQELFVRPSSKTNSVAVILRHLGGNLKSRWSDFLSTDGEKPERDRDAEFTDWPGDRSSLLEYFESGWRQLEAALESIDEEVARRTVFIRGEPHTVAQALVRSITHLSYHVGQITLVARLVHSGDWKWITIAPGDSAAHNKRTWGSAATPKHSK
jgi:uncharacterized damage-inducible protein DinB